MTCPACTIAAQQPHGIFRADCQGCAARALSRGPDFARVKRAGRLDSAYTSALQRVGVTHDQVKAAAAADKAYAA